MKMLILELPLLSRICLYLLLTVMGLFALLIWGWQIMVLRGKAMPNCDGSADNWREQKTHYGLAFADVFLACPANLIGIVLVFFSMRWGCYLIAMVSFWWVWANLMTTATSLHFEKPKLTLIWFLTFPFGILVGLAYILWSIINFNTIYAF